MFASALSSVIKIDPKSKTFWIVLLALVHGALFTTLLPQGCEIHQSQTRAVPSASKKPSAPTRPSASITPSMPTIPSTPSTSTTPGAETVTPQPQAQEQPQAKQQPKLLWGMWVWQSRCVNDENEQRKLIQFCKQQGMNRLLVQVHFEPQSVQDGAPVLLHAPQFASFLALAADAGITVESLDGEPEMALAENHAVTLAKLDTMLRFNATLPSDHQLVGFHYDIEPYTLPQWNSPKRTQIMTQYLDLFAALRRKLDAQKQGKKLLLAASIPFWYDLPGENGRGYSLKYQGQVKNFHQFIQDVTDYVAIMSYRTLADGEDSITSHIAAEMAYAEQLARFVCAGMETIQLPETPDITFWDHSPQEFFDQLGQVRQILAGRPGFGGVLTHDYPSCVRVMNGPPARASMN